MYCIDASVVTNSQITDEKFHEHSRRFMDAAIGKRVRIILPEIIIPEMASAIARGTGDVQLAMKFIYEFRKILNIDILPIERNLSNLAAEIAAKYKLRGADSIYIAVSLAYDLRLITLDKHQKQNAPNNVVVLTPEEELRNM